MSEPKGKERATIFVVDDDPACLEFLVNLFELEGFRVLSAGCATDALELLRKESNAPDLYVVDFMMPDMYGFELVNELRRIEGASSAPVIMFTATTRKIGDLVEQAGVTFVHKSTGNRKLLEALRNLLWDRVGNVVPAATARPSFA